MAQLPPDLARLGDELAAAATRGLARRRRRVAQASAAGVALIAAAAVVATGALTTTTPHRPMQLADGDLSTLIPRPPARRPLLTVAPVARGQARHRTGLTVPVVLIRHDE